MILKGTCHAVGQFESICDELVNQGIAELVQYGKDTRSKAFVNRYHVFVGEDGTYAEVRFWYNISSDKAEVKIREEGIDKLLHATTVMAMMNKLGHKVSSNGNGINLIELEALIRKALVTMTGRECDIQIEKQV